MKHINLTLFPINNNIILFLLLLIKIKLIIKIKNKIIII